MSDDMTHGERNSRDPMAVVPELITRLSSHDGMTRQHARQALVALGEPAVEPLLALLVDPRDQVRWEAAKALVDLASPRAAGSLAGALGDANAGVQWLAAEGLIALREAALRPLLKLLSKETTANGLLHGAHHVLHVLTEGPHRELVQPVLRALEGPAPGAETPVAAYEALLKLDQAEEQRVPRASALENREAGELNTSEEKGE